MSRQLLTGLTFAVVTVATVLTLAACTRSVEGTAQPAIGGTVDAVSTSTPKSSAPSSSSRPTSTRPQGGDVKFDASIGDCVTLGGTMTNATIEKASCGSRASNYKVIAKAPNSSGCPADRDNYYAETLNGVQQGALCLDIDWVMNGCMDVGGDDPQRVECTEPGTDVVRVTDIQEGVSDAGACDSGLGFEYSERNFVVCVEEV